MKTVNSASHQENTATFFIDNYGTIHDTLVDASHDSLTCVGKVIVDANYTGTLDSMRNNALKEYNK
jgi:hypothetical protein